ncbi:MAG TPA: SCO family protein [Actinomycetota bacterium]|nr:SCO family protein [Actinomycetota bacterium]
MTTRRKVLAAIGSLPVLAGAGALAARTRASASAAAAKLRIVGGPPVARPGQQSARSMVQERHLPNVPLVTQDGKTVRFYDDLVKDKKVIINFLNTQQPANCSATTTNLVNLQKLFKGRVGKDIHMYSISLNPKDTPASLKAWADQHGAGPGWLFLTGTPAAVEQLRQGLGVVYQDAFEDTNPAVIASLVRFGSESEMKWAHEPSNAHPRQIAHKVVADFGADPTDPKAAPSWFCGQFNS